MREQLKLEPTKAEKIFLKGQQEAILQFEKESREEQKQLDKLKVQDLFCMGVNKKLANGPNPLSIKRRAPKTISKDKNSKRKRRPRKGKRSKVLSALKKERETQAEA